MPDEDVNIRFGIDPADYLERLHEQADRVDFRIRLIAGQLQIHETEPAQYTRVELTEYNSGSPVLARWVDDPEPDETPLTIAERTERARQLEWDRQYAAMVNRRVAQDEELTRARQEAYLRSVAGDTELEDWMEEHEYDLVTRIESGNKVPEKPVNWSWL